jgi:hypothetical protein
MRRWIVVLALTLLIAGCAGTSENAAAGQQAQSVAPSPAALSTAEAGKRYLEIVAPYNAALEELESAAQAGESWAKLRTRAAKVAQTNQEHGQALRAIVWPEPVRAPMAALLAQIDAAQAHWQRAAQAKTADEFATEVRAAAGYSGAQAASEVRAALGLPAYSES